MKWYLLNAFIFCWIVVFEFLLFIFLVNLYWSRYRKMSKPMKETRTERDRDRKSEREEEWFKYTEKNEGGWECTCTHLKCISLGFSFLSFLHCPKSAFVCTFFGTVFPLSLSLSLTILSHRPKICGEGLIFNHSSLNHSYFFFLPSPFPSALIGVERE